MDVPRPMGQPTLIETMARHLVTDAAPDWRQHVEGAANMLALLKEPDAAMRAAGDVATWQAMIDAALIQRWTILPPAGALDHMPTGSADEEGEFALSRDAVDEDGAKWVHLPLSPTE